jgi:Winged helix DNA-binding domain
LVKRGFRIPWEQVALFRAQRHRLDRRAPRGAMLRVAGEICGLHAQVLSSAELSVWARVDQLAPAAVQSALWSEGSLVKTWAMRGTLHLLPRAELPVFFGALSTYTHFLKQAWLKYFGVTREELEEVIAALAAKGLGGGLVHHGEEGRQHRQVFHIVEANQSDVAGNDEPTFAQGLHRADGGHVVHRKDRGGPRLAREHRLDRPVASDAVDAGVEQQSVRALDAGGLQRLAITLQPLAPGGVFVAVHQVRDTAVAFYQDTARGAVLLLAVAIDQLSRRRGAGLTSAA